MDLRVEIITPEIAQQYLLFNTSNRTLRKSLVSQYARDMSAGNWKLTHQGVAFNCDGTLLDGQHRLQAIIESGVAVRMVVARGIDTKSQLVMDDHAKRSAGDALTLVRRERITATDVAIVRAAVELQENTPKARNTKTELNNLIEQFRGPLAFIEDYVSAKERGVTSAPVWGAIVLSWHYVDDLERLTAFCRMLRGYEMVVEEGDRVALILREWLLRSGIRYATQRTEAFRKTQRAIVAFMKHQRLDKLYGTNVHFPYPLVDPIRKSGVSV